MLRMKASVLNLNGKKQQHNTSFPTFTLPEYFVAMKYRRVCIFFILSESPSLNTWPFNMT